MSSIEDDDDIKQLREMLKRAVSFDNISVYADRSTEAAHGSILNHPIPDGDDPLFHNDNNPTAASSIPSAPTRTSSSVHTKKLCIVMVGLPARGKTHIASCLERFLNWLGFKSSVFNVGEYRRIMLGSNQSANFFDPRNVDGVRTRKELAMDCLKDMIRWFGRGGLVGIYDATNSTKERRQTVKNRLETAAVRVLFLESVCTDQTIIDKNISETKLRSPDYRDMDPESAAADFRERIHMYESVSEELEDDENCSYIKVINVGRKLVLNDIQGYVQGKIVSFLLNARIMSRTIYLSRHGESEWNVSGQLGGDPSLTSRGRAYSQCLAEYMHDEASSNGISLSQIWTSQLQRTIQTAALIPAMNLRWRALNEIDAGICEGLTYDEISKQYPEVARERKRDKLRYRYPSGESYVDVIHRLEPAILEIERQRGPVLIIAHNAVIRAIYAYLLGKSQEDCPYLEIPLHTVFKLTTRAYGAEVQKIEMDVDSTCMNTTPEAEDSAGEEVKTSRRTEYM